MTLLRPWLRASHRPQRLHGISGEQSALLRSPYSAAHRQGSPGLSLPSGRLDAAGPAARPDLQSLQSIPSFPSTQVPELAATLEAEYRAELSRRVAAKITLLNRLYPLRHPKFI